MKKFFGLKMTLAALAVVSFASCYDSESGDVIIPNATTVDWPAPVYIVNGEVTNLQDGTLMEGVKVGGVIASETDANGAFSVTLSSPVSGDVEFTKTGFFKTLRTLNIAALTAGQGNAVYNVNASMISTDNTWRIVDVLREKDVTEEPWTAKAKTATADDLAAIEAMYDVEFTNNSDAVKSYPIPAWTLPDQPYGVVAAAAKTDEEGQAIFFRWVKQTYDNDPYDDFGVYRDDYLVTIPAQYQVTSITITPIKVSKTLVFPLEDGDFEQPVEEVTTYVVKVDGKSLAHDHGHGHGHGTETNAGGGSGE